MLVALVALLAGGAALADGRIDFLIEHLKYPPPGGLPDDFRVRTQAALNLGASNSDAALDPLCEALSNDPKDVVRHASAVALKRLARSSSLDCLQRRLASEGVASVKLQIERAIESVQAAGGSSVAGAKYYVSIAAVTNNTTRSRAEIDGVVGAAIRGKLSEIGGYQVAPSGESPDAARSAMAKNNLKGWYLSVVVDNFDYSGGGLRARLRMAVSTYPGKDIKGELSNSGKIDGVSSGDKGREDALLTALAQALTQQFTQESKFR